MIVSFTGSRKGMTEKQIDVLRKHLLTLKPDIVVHGDCIGADAEFHEIAQIQGVAISIFPSNLIYQRAFCAGAFRVAEPAEPLARNRVIVNQGNLLIACPNTMEEKQRSGTWATVRYARKRNKPHMIIYPDGRCEGWSKVQP